MGSMSNDTVIIEGAQNIENVRVLAVRSGLSIEVKTGMKRHGRSCRVLANEIMGTNHRTGKAALADLNARLAEVGF